MTCPFYEVLYHGNRGGGKTDALIMDYAQEVGKGYKEAWRGILFRQTYKQLQDVIAKTKKWFYQVWAKDIEVKFNEADHIWTWETGEQLFLRQFQRDGDYWNYHGHEYPWIAWEELCNWPTPDGFKRMMSTNRSSHKDVPRKVRATTNPYGPGHNWVKHRFRLPGMDGVPILDARDDTGNLEPPRIAIRSLLSENKILVDNDPQYRQRMLAAARNEAERRAWDKGDWDIVAGGMFDDVYDRRYNVVKPFRIPNTWRIDRSFDWGSSKPFSVGWWAESDGTDYTDGLGQWRYSVRGDLFRIHEWYGWNGKPNEGCAKLAREVAEGIVHLELMWGLRTARDKAKGTQQTCRVKAGPADTAIFTMENGVDIAGDMAQPLRVGGLMYNGIYWTHADKRPGSRKIGWEAMRKMFKAAHPEEGKIREDPGLFIFDVCEQFQRTVPVLPRDTKNMDDVDTNAEDHIGDETRYRVRMLGTRISSGSLTGMF